MAGSYFVHKCFVCIFLKNNYFLWIFVCKFFGRQMFLFLLCSTLFLDWLSTMLHFERNSNGEVIITLGEREILQFSVFQYFSQYAPFYWSSLTWSLCFPVHFLPCERCFEEEKHSWVRSAKCYVYEEFYNWIQLLLLNTLKGGEIKALRDLVQCHPQIRHLSDSIFIFFSYLLCI